MESTFAPSQGHNIAGVGTVCRPSLHQLASPLKHVPALIGCLHRIRQYMRQGGHAITRAQFEQNFFTKLRDHEFFADIGPLVAVRQDPWDIDGEAAAISSRLIQLLPGAPWKPLAG